jgi:predicted permease
LPSKPISSGNAKTGSISLLENSNEDSIFQERDRAAGLWSILYLFVTPIVGIIIAYNLTQDLRKHEELQVTAQAAISGALRDIGLPPLPATQYRAHKRDPLLFVILSLITAGLFWIYWFYVLLKDYNEHFSDQASFEDGLLNVLKPPPVRKYCSTCGGVLEGPARFCPHCGAKQAS